MQYLQGLGNYFQTEATPGVLVPGRNSPQKVPHGLYAEQLSGSAFTMSRHSNLASWLYRILPSVVHGEFKHFMHSQLCASPLEQVPHAPNQLRWDPMPYAEQGLTFIDSLMTIAVNGHLALHCGSAIHLYAADASMENEYFYNSDGDFLIVPQEGELLFKTEMGELLVEPGEIIVIPRGIKYRVMCSGKARGYICENYGAPFRLPELGVIGANGLANPRDFQIPIACYEQRQGDFILINKFQGQLWSADIKHSPLDVVAWQGNYAPYKYALKHFNTINTVSFDHPDPSIFTVLTSPSTSPGIANIDFVIFPSRWMVAEDTFRPPYYHRNIMSEYMGLILGLYDAKQHGFVPGGGSLHNAMSAHGPDADTYQKAISAVLKPEFYANTLAFMFESCYVWQVTPQAWNAAFRQKNYLQCWQTLTAYYS